MRASTPRCSPRPRALRELYERYSTFMDRFHVGRWKRWVFIEPAVGSRHPRPRRSVLMLALAIPAFRETSDDDWLKKSDLAVSFLDRYGNPIGSRGIKHNDSIPLEDFPDHSDQGHARHRGPPLLRPFRHRHLPAPCARSSPMRRPAACARAARRSPSSWRRTCSSTTSAPSSARSRKLSLRSGWRPG